MKKCLPVLVAAILTILISFIPFPKSPVHLRFFVESYNGDRCYFYYTTDGTYNFNENQVILAPYDEETHTIEVTFDPKLMPNVTAMRLDFHPYDAKCQEIQFNDITISSGGIVQKRIIPVDFFTSENLIYLNEINAVTPYPAWRTVIISTGENNPYLVFSDKIAGMVRKCQSSYRLSRFFVCLFLAGCILPVFYRKKS